MAERALPPLYPVPEPAAFGSPLDTVAAPAVRAWTPPTPPGTYVVHVQKDQIYRIPPPENAYLAERYRAERASAGKSCAPSASCSPCVLRALGAAAAAALLLAAVVALSVVVLRPDVPSFAVDRLSVHNASAQRRVDYDFFLTAINPNKVTALWYRRGGSARLQHHGTALAKGDVGKPEDGGEDATDFKVLLHSQQHGGGRMPNAVEKGLRGAKGVVALELAVEIPVQVHVGALGFATKRLTVACEISTAGLMKDVHISSQNCKSRFGD